MASASLEPKAPNAQVLTTSGPNDTPRIDAYTDPALTTRNSEETPVEAPLPAKSGPKTLGNTRPFYAEDLLQEIDQTSAETENAAVEQPPHSPNSWQMQTRNGNRYSRDPYANNGLDPYLQNQGDS